MWNSTQFWEQFDFWLQMKKKKQERSDCKERDREVELLIIRMTIELPSNANNLIKAKSLTTNTFLIDIKKKQLFSNSFSYDHNYRLFYALFY